MATQSIKNICAEVVKARTAAGENDISQKQCMDNIETPKDSNSGTSYLTACNTSRRGNSAAKVAQCLLAKPGFKEALKGTPSVVVAAPSAQSTTTLTVSTLIDNLKVGETVSEDQLKAISGDSVFSATEQERFQLNKLINPGTSEGKRIAAQTALARMAIDNQIDAPKLASVEESHVKSLSDDNKGKIKAKLPELEKTDKSLADKIKGFLGDAAIDAAKPKDAGTAAAGDHSGFFGRLLPGISLSSATYTDSSLDSNPAASSQPIKTTALWGGRKPEGNPPSVRLSAALGYVLPKSIFGTEKSDIYFGISGRYSAIKQGFEDPELGRHVPDMTQKSGILFAGIQYPISTNWSTFGEVGVGVTHNSFDRLTGDETLQTSPLAMESAFLKPLEGFTLAGTLDAGVAYQLSPLVALQLSMQVYTDGTSASTRTPGGGRLDSGTTGLEATFNFGISVGKKTGNK